jgi:hypothetical protein
MLLPRLQACLQASGKIGGTGTEKSHLRSGGQIPQHVQIRITRAAVIKDRRGSRQQAALKDIPHHPARGAESEKSVARVDIHVQFRKLHELDQNTAVPMHKGFRQSGFKPF